MYKMATFIYIKIGSKYTNILKRVISEKWIEEGQI